MDILNLLNYDWQSNVISGPRQELQNIFYIFCLLGGKSAKNYKYLAVNYEEFDYFLELIFVNLWIFGAN